VADVIVGFVLRGLLLVGLATMILAAVPAQAGVSSGDDENDYEGLVDNNDDHYFGFDVNASKTKVKGITARLGYACDNDDLVITLVEADGSLRLNDARRFSGVVTFRENPNNKVKYEVRGKLKKQGNAEGTLKGTFEDPFYDTPCEANEDPWRAKRGADLDAR